MKNPLRKLSSGFLLLVLVIAGIGIRSHQNLSRPYATTGVGNAMSSDHAGPAEGLVPAAQEQVAGAAARPKGQPAREVEVCGHGKILVDPDDSWAIWRQVADLSKGAGLRWSAALEDSGDVRARAAGLLLEDWLTSAQPLKPSEQARDAVVQLAAGGEDPTVYAIAVSMCGVGEGEPIDTACQRITLSRWTQLDPDNAIPWLVLAGRARQQQDRAVEADAFSHAASAHRLDDYNWSLYAVAEPQMPQDATPLDRVDLAMQTFGLEAALVMPYGSTMRHCSASAMLDAQTHQECESLAELFVNRSSTLLEFGIGRGLGARAGWSPQRVSSLEDEQDALMQAIAQAAPSDGADLWSCDAVRRNNAFIGQRMQLGEIAAAREALARSGETVEAMAEKQRQSRQNLLDDAQRQLAQDAPPEPAQ